MTLHCNHETSIPVQTIEIARSAFPNGNIYMTLREELGVVFRDEQFQSLYPQRGQPAEAPWRLALITLMQFREGLTDRQAADAVRSRIDWKYVLGLELNDPGFHYSVLCEFRSRLIEAGAEQTLFNTILELCRERGFLTERGKQRTDSTYIIGAVRTMNRIEVAGEALFHALDLLAQIDPIWLKAQIPSEWFERYRQRPTSFHLPKSEKGKLELALQIGEDGQNLLSKIYTDSAPEYLRKLPVIDTMRRIWIQNYYQEEDTIEWREEKDCPPASLRVVSPYDIEVRSSTHGDAFWRGYKVHFTETCDEQTPHLITHVETTLATEQDTTTLPRIHSALERKKLLPIRHFVDAGYPSAELLATSQSRFGIDLYGPVRPDLTWQTQTGQGFTMSQFSIDWDHEKVICPMGRISIQWLHEYGIRGKPFIQARFRKQDCLACSSRAHCTRSASTPRHITLQPTREQQLALQAARERQT